MAGGRISRRTFGKLGIGAAIAARTWRPELAGATPADTVAQMTLDEKIALVHGVFHEGDIGFVPANATRNIPAIRLTDGPGGVRVGPPATAFPAPLAVAAAFDRQLAHDVGAAVASEAKWNGQNVLFGPGVNLARIPTGGRNFDYFGEDPHLTSRMAVSTVQGIQAQGILATLKHYICNDQEANRRDTFAEVDERTLRELYLPPFEAAITEAKAGAVMAANSGVNGLYCAQSPALLSLLKTGLAFPGFVVSDYSATHDTVAAANAGLDMDLPSDQYFGAALRKAVVAGTVPVAVLDDKCRRILGALAAQGLFEGTPKGPAGTINTQAHKDLAVKAAGDAMVLLRNAGNLLPITPGSVASIAVLGYPALAPKIGGSGSSEVKPAVVTNAITALKARYPSASVAHEAGATTGDVLVVPTAVLSPPGQTAFTGLKGEYFKTPDLTGTPVFTRTDPFIDGFWGKHSTGAGIPIDNFSVRWSGTVVAPATGVYTFEGNARSGCRLFVNGTKIIDHWNEVGTFTGTIALTRGQRYPIRFEFHSLVGGAYARLAWTTPSSPETDPAGALDRAVALAAASDVAIVFAADIAGEDLDRATFGLPGNQDELIARVAAANPRTVVVLNTSGPVAMDWLASVPALVQAWYPGQGGATALAQVVAGDRDPGGRLPMTFGKSAADYPASTPAQYPGIDGVMHYSEGIFVGYRHFDAHAVAPAFPFGHGLSYTSFAYSDIAVSSTAARQFSVAVTVKNTGARAGTDVVQLYLAPPLVPGVPMAPQQLAGFQKVRLAPGASQRVSMPVPTRALSYWDAGAHAWKVATGTFVARVARSSRDVKLTKTFTVT